MSLRAEYTHTCIYSPLFGRFMVDLYHQPIGSTSPKKVGSKAVKLRSSVNGSVDSLMRAHMEKVTRMLDTPAEPSEQADQLAHRGDQQQQEEKDHE